jgi:hypothetical protein
MFAHVRVTNRSNRIVYRQIGNCGDVSSIIVDQRPLMPSRSWSGIAATFKQRVLDERGFGLSYFQNVTRIDLPPRGCGDIFGLDPVKPGAVLNETRAWDAIGYFGRPVLPGPTMLTATFAYYPDSKHRNPSDERKLNILTEIRVEGKPTGETWIGEYVDRALAEPRFADWLDDQPETSWINTSVAHWPNDDGEYPAQPVYLKATQGTVDIGLFRWDEEEGEYGGLILDLPSGDLLGFRFEECC